MTARPRNAIGPPKWSKAYPAIVGLSAAPMPMALPTRPSATLNLPVPIVMSAIMSGNSTASTAAETPSSAWAPTTR